jgi:hypothetical protein
MAHYRTISAIYTIFRRPPNGIILRLVKRIYPLARQAIQCAEMRESEILHAKGKGGESHQQEEKNEEVRYMLR